MSTLHLNKLNEGEWDLIADEVLDALDAGDEAALVLVDPAARAAAREALEHAAGALAGALAETEAERMPTLLVERITRQCARMSGGSAAWVPETIATVGVQRVSAEPGKLFSGTDDVSGGSGVVGRIAPWMIAAAACVVAAVSMWPTSSVSPRTQIAMLRANATDTRVASWSAWSLEGQPPTVAGVAGEVVWSDTEQAGVLHFAGLPPCEVGKRYQLWIVDAERGFEQRISGAIFDGGPGDVYVPVKPKIPVHKAQAFAVTIEQADGTWVSDMSQRVVIAMVK